MEDSTTTAAVPSAGRGRGRGRGGGVAVLPAGLWDSLNSTADKPIETSTAENLESFLHDKDAQGQFDDRKEERDNNTHNSNNNTNINNRVPPAAQRTRREGEEDAFSVPKGVEKDLKGRDWSCPSCLNLNWSWRANCNKCGVMKPVISNDERRDGVGGGFNERQDRASSTAVEIDEEGFDDFGRRIKKGVADRRAKEEAALRRLQEKYKHLLPGTGTASFAASASVATSRDEFYEKKATPATTAKESSSANDKKRDDSRRRDSDRDRDREREKEKDRERDRDRDRDRRDSRDRNKDRERERDRDRDRDSRRRDRDSDRRRSRSRSRDRDRDRDNYRR